MMDKFKISIVIPTYNAGKYLGKCLESIALQNDINYEVIVIDGGSTDETLSILDSYSSIISIYISEKDNGQGDAVNKGLKLIKGDVCHWHSADDIVLPRAFHRVRSSFSRNKNIKLVISDGYAFNNKKIVATGKCRWINYRTSLFHFARFQSDCAYWASEIKPSGLLLDFKQPLSVDEDFFLRLWQGHQHEWINKPLGAFRLREGQLSQTLSRDELKQDRRNTRKKIFTRDGIGPYEEKLMKYMTLPEHLLRNRLLPNFVASASYLNRIMTHDKYRKNITKALNSFCESSDAKASKYFFNELDKLMFR